MLTKEIDVPVDVQQREKLFLSLYRKAFPDVARYISKRGGSFEEARDVFQDAVIAYYEKIGSRDFRPEKNEKAYLFGIAKYLWFKKAKEQSGVLPLEGLDPAEETFSSVVPDKAKLMRYLATAGEKCMEMLRSFYYHRSSMKEIAVEFGFTSERSATVQKYKCLEKVRNAVKEKSLEYEDFLA